MLFFEANLSNEFQNIIPWIERWFSYLVRSNEAAILTVSSEEPIDNLFKKIFPYVRFYLRDLEDREAYFWPILVLLFVRIF